MDEDVASVLVDEVPAAQEDTCRQAAEDCPVEAITRDDRGIVLINEELCTGCKECVDACPYGAMQYDEDRELAVKCDLCNERLTRGEAPACSLACPAHCIIWGNMNKIPDRVEVV